MRRTDARIAGRLERTAADGRVVLGDALGADAASAGQAARIPAGAGDARRRQRAVGVGDALSGPPAASLVRLANQTYFLFLF